MAKPNFGKTELNESPDLSMAEITEQMFNNQFLSDVQFQIDGITIYAHSWELMKRSVPFQNQLRATVGETKLIHIGDTTYDVFYQFIRFIYTDECQIIWHNQIELLKLARKYKVIKLETKVINAYPDGNLLKMFEFCILEQYDLTYCMKNEQLQTKEYIFNHHEAQSVHPKAMQQILKFNYLMNYKECEVFDALIKWINKSCEMNKISRSERRSRFDPFIRLIRFPTMTPIEFSNCIKDYRDLFSNEDIATIFKKISLGVNCTDGIWNATPRLMDIKFHTSVKTTDNTFKSSFTVSSYITVCGLRMGGMSPPADFSIQILAQDLKTKLKNDLNFKFERSPVSSTSPQHIINLGNSIELKPNIQYTIEYKIAGEPQAFNVFIRLGPTDVALTGPSGIIKNLHSARNLFEIIYAYTN